MSLLHVVNGPRGLDSCLAGVADGDAVLLLGDGVYAASDARLSDIDVPVVAIDEDVDARGVALGPSVDSVGYDGFVALVVAHDASVTWG